jgi:hypothetical protein
MLSFRQYLVEYDFDPNIRGMSPTEMGLPTGTGPVRPSISKVGEDADRELMPIIQRLASEGKLSNIGINSDSEIPKPSEMPLKRLHRLSVAAGEHLDGLDQAVWNIHTHKLVAHHPKANLTAQNLGGVAGEFEGTALSNLLAASRQLQRRKEGK